MSSVHSLCWLPSSLCIEMPAALQDTLGHWTSTWGLPGAGAVQACVLDADEMRPPDGFNLHEPTQPAWRNAVARALFQGGVGESRIVDAVIRRVVDQLEAQLKSRFPRGSQREQARRLPGHQGVRLMVELLGESCWVELGIAQLRAGRWIAAAAQPPLQPVDLEAAVSELPMDLTAQLGRASIGVLDLMQLLPGDVLLLEETLDAPLRVVSPGCSLALSAHLGAFADPPRRAARWLAS